MRELLLQILLMLPIETGISGTIIYSLIGMLMAILGYKIMDWLTPGKLSHKIFEGNVAVAILASALIIGICIIIAAAIHS